MKNKRQHARHDVYGGNAEITAVMGRGHRPDEAARIMDWSRGGLRLRVKSPRRKMLFLRQEDCLFEGDTLYCTLHLPPRYDGISIQGTVVHIARPQDDPSCLEIGLAVSSKTPEKVITHLAKHLEPRARSSRRRRVSA